MQIGRTFLVISLLLGSQPGRIVASWRGPKMSSTSKVTESRPADVQDIVSPLSLSESNQREIKGGDTQIFSLQLVAGQYARIALQRNAIDLLIDISDPDGQKLIEMSNPAGNRGPVYLSVRAKWAGTFLVKVKPTEPAASIGRFAIKLDALRAASPEDERRLLAEQKFAEGRRLQSGANKSDALEMFADALPIWGENAYEQANTLHSMALVYKSLGDLPNAETNYKKALELRKRLMESAPDAESLADATSGYAYTLNDLAAAYRDAKPSTELSREVLASKALDLYAQSRTTFKTLNDIHGESAALHGMGVVYFHAQDGNKALEYFELALTLRRAENDLAAQARTLNFEGGVYDRLLQPQPALRKYEEAAKIFKTLGDVSSVANLRNNIGKILHDQSQFQEALDNYLFALASYDQLLSKNPSDLTVLTRKTAALDNAATVYQFLGNFEDARTYLVQSLAIRFKLRDAKRDDAGVGRTYARIGYTQYLQGEFAEAMETCVKALSYLKGEEESEAQTNTIMGMIDAAMGKTDQAIQRFQTSAGIQTRKNDLSGLVFTLDNLGRAFAQKKDLTAALEYFDRALRICSERKDRDVEAVILYDMARAERPLDFGKANRDIQNAVAIVETLRTKTGSRELRSSYFALKIDYFELAIDLKMQSALPGEVNSQATREALELSERARARSLIDILAAARMDASVVPRTIAVNEMQRLLDDDTILLEYFLGSEKSYVWAVSKSEVRVYPLTGRLEVERHAKTIYDLISSDKSLSAQPAGKGRADADGYWSQASTLSDELLGPVAEQLKAKRLLIVADGELQYLPFGALPEPSTAANRTRDQFANPTPLILRHEIISLPSASALAMLRSEVQGRKPAPKTIAVLADPVFEREDSRLPQNSAATDGSKNSSVYKGSAGNGNGSQASRNSNEESEPVLARLQSSAAEARNIMNLVPARERLILTGLEANIDAATQPQLRDYRIIHFATHAILNDKEPRLSGIALSRFTANGKPSAKSFLRLGDIYKLKLPADLVVLSACSTALGTRVRGEGLVGLTRGFMYAGSPRIISSLWQADDEATAELMNLFYRYLLKEHRTSAAALRQAQIDLWKQSPGRSPYYWAAFVLHGEWQ